MKMKQICQWKWNIYLSVKIKQICQWKWLLDYCLMSTLAVFHPYRGVSMKTIAWLVFNTKFSSISSISWCANENETWICLWKWNIDFSVLFYKCFQIGLSVKSKSKKSWNTYMYWLKTYSGIWYFSMMDSQRLIPKL